MKHIHQHQILNELTNICIYLIDRRYYNAADTVDIVEIILKNYLLLLDTNEFIDIIIQHYSSANQNFISEFHHSSTPLDIANVITYMKYESQEKMYYRLLDQISSSTRIISFLKNELVLSSSSSLSSSNNNDNNIKQAVNNSCRIILIIIFRILQNTITTKMKFSITKLKKYENTL